MCECMFELARVHVEPGYVRVILFVGRVWKRKEEMYGLISNSRPGGIGKVRMQKAVFSVHASISETNEFVPVFCCRRATV